MGCTMFASCTKTKFVTSAYNRRQFEIATEHNLLVAFSGTIKNGVLIHLIVFSRHTTRFDCSPQRSSNHCLLTKATALSKSLPGPKDRIRSNRDLLIQFILFTQAHLKARTARPVRRVASKGVSELCFWNRAKHLS